MSKHKDSKHCSCAGCQDANGMSRSNIINIVDMIIQHGGKLDLNKTKTPEVARTREVIRHGYGSDELQAAMLKDAGVS